MTDQHDDESRAPEGEPTTPTDPTASTEPTVSAEPEGTELAPGEQPPSDVTPTDSSEVTAVEPLPAPDHGTAVMCAECGENPARAAITIRHVTSYGLRFRRVERTAALCDACGHRALDEASASTLVKGLWGPRAAGAAWGAVSNNNQQRRFLEPVPAKQDGQQVRRPVFSRPAVWGALLVWVVVVVAFVGLVVARFLPSNNSLKTASDYVGTCWTSAQQSTNVSCSNPDATDKIVAVVATPADCDKVPGFDGYYIDIKELKKTGCLTPVKH